jgi:hypothetical protein
MQMVRVPFRPKRHELGVFAVREEAIVHLERTGLALARTTGRSTQESAVVAIENVGGGDEVWILVVKFAVVTYKKGHILSAMEEDLKFVLACVDVCHSVASCFLSTSRISPGRPPVAPHEESG